MQILLQTNHCWSSQKRIQAWALLACYPCTALQLESEKQYHEFSLLVQAMQCPPLAPPWCTDTPYKLQTHFPGLTQAPLRSSTNGKDTSALFFWPVLVNLFKTIVKLRGGSLMYSFFVALEALQCQQLKKFTLERGQAEKKGLRKAGRLFQDGGQTNPYSLISATGIGSYEGTSIFGILVADNSMLISRHKSMFQLTFWQLRQWSRLARKQPKTFQMVVSFILFPDSSMALRYILLMLRWVISPSFNASSRHLSNYWASCWAMERKLLLTAPTASNISEGLRVPLQLLPLLNKSWNLLLMLGLGTILGLLQVISSQSSQLYTAYTSWAALPFSPDLAKSMEGQSWCRSRVAYKHWRMELQKQVLPKLFNPNTLSFQSLVW